MKESLCLAGDDVFALQLEPQKYSIYREQAVNSISVALDASLNNEKVREKCCRALFVLAGHFSSTGKILTKRGILKEVGYQTGISEAKNPDHEEEGLLRNGAIFFVSFLSNITVSSITVFLCM